MNHVLHVFALVPIFLFGAVYVVAGPRPYHRAVFDKEGGMKELFRVLGAGAVGVVVILVLMWSVLGVQPVKGFADFVGPCFLFLGLCRLADVLFRKRFHVEANRLVKGITSTGALFIAFVLICTLSFGCHKRPYEDFGPFYTVFYAVATSGSAWLYYKTGVKTPWAAALGLTLLSASLFLISVSAL